MRFPDGSFYPSVPYQCRDFINLITDANGNCGFVVQPDDMGQFAYSAVFATPNNVSGWVGSGGNTQLGFPNQRFENDWQIQDDLGSPPGLCAQYRALAARLCYKPIVSTGVDGGVMYVGTSVVDPVVWASDWNGSTSHRNTYPTGLPDDFRCVTLSDFPVREGFEAVLQPLDPTSRRYRTTFTSVTDEWTSQDSVQTNIGLTDRWPFLVVVVVGAEPSTSIGRLEVVTDLEVQPSIASGALAKTAIPSPPSNPVLTRAIGEAYRALQESGQNIVSRFATQAVGGITNFLKEALGSGVRRMAYSGLDVLGGGLGRGMGGLGMAAMMRLMSRPLAAIQGPSRIISSPRIEELD